MPGTFDTDVLAVPEHHEITMNHYIEFRGYKGQRVAIGKNASFMVTEVNASLPVTFGDGSSSDNGCMVNIGHYNFYTQDFYQVVLNKICSVGTAIGELGDLLGDHECSKPSQHS